MPIYEYQCTDCKTVEEKIIPILKRDDIQVCEKCQGESKRIENILGSNFSVGGVGTYAEVKGK